jgi:hypothetical protein
MARASRHHIPGQVWDITHGCHKKELLLKFARDRKRWSQLWNRRACAHGAGGSGKEPDITCSGSGKPPREVLLSPKTTR